MRILPKMSGNEGRDTSFSGLSVVLLGCCTLVGWGLLCNIGVSCKIPTSSGPKGSMVLPDE